MNKLLLGFWFVADKLTFCRSQYVCNKYCYYVNVEAGLG